MFVHSHAGGKLRFVVRPTRGVRKVEVFGDFTNGLPIRMRRTPENRFVLDARMPPGRYRYRLRIDDRWLPEDNGRSNRRRPRRLPAGCECLAAES